MASGLYPDGSIARKNRFALWWRPCGRDGFPWNQPEMPAVCLSVHHRRHGVSRERLPITLSPGHDAQLHRLRFLDRIVSLFVDELWRKQRFSAPEQLFLSFGSTSVELPARTWPWGTFRVN